MENDPMMHSAAALAFEQMPVPALLLDMEDRLLRANAAARLIHADPPAGACLAELAPELESRTLEGGAWRLAVALEADERRLANLASACADSGKLAHEIRNAQTAVHLALRAVAKALGEDEQTVLEELAERLEDVERRLREALEAR
ncbi:MAG: hypothetical protein CMJ84_17990 [Planctomycetes bacterium]|nr:hypothetical protein [Planctomycetota bacterium]MDP6409698.1 hypothetical protein [Planctomycetota bacterium]